MCEICKEIDSLNFTQVVNKLLSIHHTLDFEHIQHIAATVLMRESSNCENSNRVKPEGYDEAFENLEVLRAYYQGEEYQSIDVSRLFSGSLFRKDFNKEIN